MSELNQANEKLDKLTDKQVRIVYLPPATVAAYQYEGDEPEMHVNQVVDKFVRESGLARIKPDMRHFGFNAPNPVDETGRHGYEMWVTIPDDMDAPADVVMYSLVTGMRFDVPRRWTLYGSASKDGLWTQLDARDEFPAPIAHYAEKAFSIDAHKAYQYYRLTFESKFFMLSQVHLYTQCAER